MSSQKAVVVIPLKGNKFLMVKNPGRGWEFPGGKIESGESTVDAAKRECKEEAGIMIENVVELGVEGDVIFMAACIKEILKEHQFKSSFFEYIPDKLAFSHEEAEKYITLAFVKLRGMM